MTHPAVVGVDPGKKGYECALYPTGPVFWPAPVREAGEESEYDLRGMVGLATHWAATGVALVVLEQQAHRGHGTREQLKFGIGREGGHQTFTLGFGFGAWQTALVAAGYERPTIVEASYLNRPGARWYVIVEPRSWKAAMGAVGFHRGEDTQAARRKANDAASIKAALAVQPGLDLRPLEKSPVARVPSPDKAVSRLLAEYGLRRLLGCAKEMKEERTVP